MYHSGKSLVDMHVSGADSLMNSQPIAVQTQRIDRMSELFGNNMARPYVYYFQRLRHKQETRSLASRLREWFTANVVGSVFFMGWRSLLAILTLQAVLVVLLETDVITDVTAAGALVSTLRVDTFHFFLLTVTVGSVVSINRSAIVSFSNALSNGVMLSAGLLLPALKNGVDWTAKRHEVYAYSNGSTGRLVGSRIVSTVELLIETRHILAAFAYQTALLSSRRTASNALTVLTPSLYDELFAYWPAASEEVPSKMRTSLMLRSSLSTPTDSLVLRRLLGMYLARVDLLFENQVGNPGSLNSQYGQARSLHAALVEYETASKGIAQPSALLNVITMTTYTLLFSYPFTVYAAWNWWQTMLILVGLDCLLHGMLMFVRRYHDPFRLSVRGVLSAVDIRYLVHTSVWQMDDLLSGAIFSCMDAKRAGLHSTKN